MWLTRLRSFLFVPVFYLNTALFVVGGSFLLLGPRSWAMAGLRAHAIVSLWLLRWIVGTRMEVRGREKLPKPPYLVASKHQSAWDTFALIPIFSDPAMVMKAELRHIPFHGWFSRKFEHVFVARERGPGALRNLLRDAKARAAAGREVVIFPEGTRRKPGAEPDYKSGVVALYEGLGLACVPWRSTGALLAAANSLMRYPGTSSWRSSIRCPPGCRAASSRRSCSDASRWPPTASSSRRHDRPSHRRSQRKRSRMLRPDRLAWIWLETKSKPIN